MSFFQRIVPLVLSTHQRYRLLSASATFRKRWLPQMIGVAPVLLGMASFQAMFSFVLQWSGRPFSLLRPFRLGPRHCGQFSASTGSESAQNNNPSDWRGAKSFLLLSRRAGRVL